MHFSVQFHKASATISRILTKTFEHTFIEYILVMISILFKTELLETYLKACSFIKETPTQVFPVNIAKYLGTPMIKQIYERLLLPEGYARSLQNTAIELF